MYMPVVKQDGIQQAIQSLAYTNSVTRDVAVFFAAWLVFVLAALWVLVALTQLRKFTPALLVRLVVLVVVAVVLSKVLSHFIFDTRPYILSGIPPLTPVARDNGFPSDHTLAATVITISFWWLNRRWLPVFGLATLLIMLGRLGIGAHHSLDVAGSVVIVLVAFLIAALLPLPVALKRPILPPGKLVTPVVSDFDAPTQPDTRP
jgi:membrane-associated phospholipid phosphatase